MDTTDTTGAYVHALLSRQVHRIGKLQPQVLADQDPEPLHQLRVSFRRLRTILNQFAPALSLPPGVTGSSIARVARRTGRTRDLDVLLNRLHTRLLPTLPEQEYAPMEPFLRHLDHERDHALAELVRALRGGRHRRLMKRLPRWLEQPRFTALGELPLIPWLYEWVVPISSGLFLHLGWFCRDPLSEELHDLRKRIKGVRYALEHLESFLDDEIRGWVGELKQAQDDLGDLHDLQVLAQTLAKRKPSLGPDRLPSLHAEIARQQEDRWSRWVRRAERMGNDDRRLAIHRHLALPAAASGQGRSPQSASSGEPGDSASKPH